MHPNRTVRNEVTLLALFAALIAAAPAHAQFLENIRRVAVPSADPLGRSARLIGMGGVTLVLPDQHQRIDLWELTNNPAGMLESDSSTTLELTPGMFSRSGVHDLPEGTQRQDFALKDNRLNFEAWRRSSGETAFGVIGDYGTFRTDNPYNTFVEQRTQVSIPNITGVISGKAPFLFPEHFRYGMSVNYRYQSIDDDFLTVTFNGAGEWLDQDGRLLQPPDAFTPDRTSVRSLGLGGGLAWMFGPPATLAVGAEYTTNEIDGQNDGDTYASEVREDRPYSVVQAALTGRFAGLEYLADTRSWSSSSDQRWVVSVSGGTGRPPLTGRGPLQGREEDGNAFTGRVRWVQGPFELGGGALRYDRTVDLTPPPADAQDSFNAFRNRLYNLQLGDLTPMPDSAVLVQFSEEAWDYSAAAAMHVPFREMRVAAEFHTGGSTTESDRTQGPEGAHWDVRGGAEIRATPTLQLRGGYRYVWDDHDENTERNEFIGQAITAGLGYRPVAAKWFLDAGYVYEWGRADFGDPTSPRSSGQRMLLRVRWDI